VTSGPAATADPSVVAVVVTWNSAGVVSELLASLPAAMGATTWRLVVVDNESSDDTVDVVRHAAPGATVIELGRNAGYAAGINAGWAAAPDAAAMLVLNPDIRLGPGAVEALVGGLKVSHVGITVPRITNSDGTLSFSLRRRPTVARALGEAVVGGLRAGRHPAWGEMIVDPGVYESAGAVDWASGAVMLLSRPCMERVGPWDESLWLYSEETDFALRARKAGFALWFVPDAGAVHLGGGAHVDPHLWATLTVNRVRVFRRDHGPTRTLAFWGALLLNELLRAVAGRPTSRVAVGALLSMGRHSPRATAATRGPTTQRR